MGLADIINVSKIKAENEELKKMLTPEMSNTFELQKKNNELTKHNSELSTAIVHQQNILHNLENEIRNKQNMILTLDDDILVQDFGLYKPLYNFANSDMYKEKLSLIRKQQKEMIKSGTAATGNMNWTVNNSKAAGNKMVKDMQKLLLRAFNSECDELVAKVKYNNIDTCINRIKASYTAISKLGTIMNISITSGYYNLKIDELHLAYEYALKKQEEKEALREARAEMREAAKLQKEIDEQRKKVEKEQQHYKNALLTVLKQIDDSTTPSAELLQKKEELETQLGEIDLTIKDLDYREANQRAGYVYVISNIGAFGENIYKIGMTRRLNPQDRVDELGDASVPFNFDVHAMIFSDDAPALENALHKAFEDRKVNMINHRREFFNVTLDEIKDVVKRNFDKTVEFVDVPDAQQYRETQKIKMQHQ